MIEIYSGIFQKEEIKKAIKIVYEASSANKIWELVDWTINRNILAKK